MRALVAVAALAVALVAAADAGTSSSSAEWAQFGFDAGHSDSNRLERTIGRGNVRSLRIVWKAQLEAPVYLAPAVSGNVVYVSAGGLFALDQETGRPLWRTSATGGSPAVGSGIVYSGRDALDSATGVTKWRSIVSPAGPGTPTLHTGTLYVSGVRGTTALAALDAQSGRPLWVRPHLDCNFDNCSPAVAKGAVYVNAGPSKSVPSATLEALDARTGATLWTKRVGMPNTGSPAVAGGKVYLPAATCRSVPCKAGRHHYLMAFSARDGSRLWRAPIGESDVLPSVMPAVAGGVVYHATYHGYLYALRAASGERLWRIALNDLEPGATVANGVVYVAAGDRVVALDNRNGKVLWSHAIDDEAGFAPVIANGSLFVGSARGTLFSFRLVGRRSSA